MSGWSGCSRDPARRKHVVRAPAHLLSGIATCPKCGRGLHYRRHAQRPRRFLRVREGPGRVRRDGDQGGPAGGVRDRRGAGRAGIPARASKRCAQGEDQHAPRRAELLAQIRDAQERRDEARRDYSGRVIDRADWLDIRQRTEDDIGAARREVRPARGIGHRS